MLKIKGLRVSSNDKEILKGLNLELVPKSVSVIMGPNGSGKTTLSKAILGYYSDTKGSIEYDYNLKKVELVGMSPDKIAKMGIFLSFQYPTELPGVTNFIFLKTIFNAHLKAQGAEEMDAIDFREHISPYLEMLSINEAFLERFVNQDFSGGEKKKNEMLQMLLLKPKLAILDETDSGLDVDALQIVSKAINSLKDTTFILVTHYNRILQYVKPDFVHILVDGSIVKSAEGALAEEIETRGYNWI